MTPDRTGTVSTTSVLRWSWLLGVALMAPAALPAGGADRRQPQPRRRAASGPLHTSSYQPLRLSPLAVAPRLSTLKPGSSLRLLRRWSTADGQDWLHVQTLSGDQRRGWLLQSCSMAKPCQCMSWLCNRGESCIMMGPRTFCPKLTMSKLFY